MLSVLENRPRNCEILVVLGQSYEDPYQLSDEVRFLPALGSGFAACLNLGINTTSAPIVHLLACGSTVSEGWTESAMAHFGDPCVAAVAPLVLDPVRSGRVVAAGMEYRPGGKTRPLCQGRSVKELPDGPRRILAPHRWAGFYRKSAWETAGQFSVALGNSVAGIDLGLTLHHLGFHTLLEPRSQVFRSTGGEPGMGALRRALEEERLFWRWAPTTGYVRSVALHGVVVAGEGLRGILNFKLLPQMIGRLTGFFRAGSGRDHLAQLRQLRETVRQQLAAPAKSPHFAAIASRASAASRGTQRMKSAG